MVLNQDIEQVMQYIHNIVIKFISRNLPYIMIYDGKYMEFQCVFFNKEFR